MDALGGALWLARKHPAYFHWDLSGWLERTSTVERIAVWTLDGLLTLAWLARQAVNFRDDERNRIGRAAAVVSRTFVTQRDVHVNITEGVHEGIFWLATAARLLRGLTNCEGQNHLLALLLLRSGVRGVTLFETGPHDDGSRHTLVRLHVRGEPAFADAWGDAPLYRLRDGTADLPALEALRASGLRERQGIYPSRCYEKGRVIGLGPRGWPRRWLSADGPTREPAPPDEALSSLAAARAHALFGRHDEALSRFEKLAQSRNAGWCALVASAELTRQRG